MRKSILGFVLCMLAVNVNAALVTDTILAFDSSIGCPVGVQCAWNDGLVYGSYIGVDANGDGVIQETDKTAISPGYDGE